MACGLLLANCGAPVPVVGGTDGGPDAGGGVSDGGSDAGLLDSGPFDGGLNQGGDGGSTSTPGPFCGPCIENSGCADAGVCLGEVGHCGADCWSGQACPTGSTCQGIGVGKLLVAIQCVPTVLACGSLTTLPAGLVCSDTWAGFADAFFGVHCRSCHRHDASFLAAQDLAGQIETVRQDIDRGSMPPVGEPAVSAADRKRILDWLACGAH